MTSEQEITLRDFEALVRQLMMAYKDERRVMRNYAKSWLPVKQSFKQPMKTCSD